MDDALQHHSCRITLRMYYASNSRCDHAGHAIGTGGDDRPGALAGHEYLQQHAITADTREHDGFAVLGLKLLGNRGARRTCRLSLDSGYEKARRKGEPGPKGRDTITALLAPAPFCAACGFASRPSRHLRPSQHPFWQLPSTENRTCLCAGVSRPSSCLGWHKPA